MIDQRVEKRKKAIGKIAARILPKVRQAELQRVASLHKGVHEDYKPKYQLSDGGRKYDRRYKFFKHILNREETELIELNDLTEAIKVGFSLFEKTKIQVPVPPGVDEADWRELFHLDMEKKIKAHIGKTLDEGPEFEGTNELLKRYKKDTPGELTEDTEITASQLKEFEVLVDRIFKKFNIDFDFTNHFADRLNDSRNSPKITLKELGALIKKIYEKQGKPFKDHPNAQFVLNDIQSDLNMPVKIEWDKRNNEIDVVAKTIMRKPGFKSPDPILKY
jgi:hypothetical protein